MRTSTLSRMLPEIGLSDVRGRSIDTWTVVEGHVLVTFPGDPQSRTLRCVCGRTHWTVETRTIDGRSILALRCHGCGTRVELLLVPRATSPVG